MTLHVRWPARSRLVGKHRAGLDFSFVSFLCIKTKKRKEAIVITYALSFACAKESAKEKHTGNGLQPLPGP